MCEKTFTESLHAALFSFMACLFTFRENLLEPGCSLHSKLVLYKISPNYNNSEQWFGVSDTLRHLLQLGMMHFAFSSQLTISRKSVKQPGIIVRIKYSKTPLCCTKNANLPMSDPRRLVLTVLCYPLKCPFFIS